VTLKTPNPKKISYSMKAHGDERVDLYYWMRNLDEDKDVLPYLKEENSFTKSFLEDTSKLQDDLYKEMRSRKNEEETTVPARDGEFYYYDRYVKGSEYAIHCRKPLDSEAEEVLLDVNELAKGKDFVDIGAFSISPNGKIMAYSLDDNGSEVYKIYLKNLETNTMYEEVLENAYDSICWFNDSEHLCYNVLNDNLRPFQVKRHKVASDTSLDEIIYTEESGEFFVHCAKSTDEEYIYVASAGSVSTEYSYIKASEPTSKFKLFQERIDNLEYDIDHHAGSFYILTNDEHENFRVVKTSIENTEKENWKEFISGSKSKYLLGFDTFKEFSILTYRENGLRNFEVVFFDERKNKIISFPQEAYSASGGENYQFDTSLFRYSYSALNCPKSVFEFDVNTGKSRCLKVTEVPGFDGDNYQVQRKSLQARDGKLVPVSILTKKGVDTSKAPLFVYGYGSYGSAIEPSFREDFFSLIDRGFNFALIHPRGSSTLGRQWYEDGKFLNKMNTFYDFVDATKELCKEGFGLEGEVVAMGGSAGGLLMGAITNLAPELYKTIVAEVPFVDVLTTMLDKDLPLTQLEYKEWGNPEDQEYYNYIKSYSPYDNLKEASYPHILATAGLNDPRVTYWEPAKWVARIRDLNQSNSDIHLYTNMGAGHGGASGRFEYLIEEAMIYAFILKTFMRT
jgi:oligopeptidase B